MFLNEIKKLVPALPEEKFVNGFWIMPYYICKIKEEVILDCNIDWLLHDYNQYNFDLEAVKIVYRIHPYDSYRVFYFHSKSSAVAFADKFKNRHNYEFWNKVYLKDLVYSPEVVYYFTSKNSYTY